jgi:hypothetical protein
MRRPRASKMVIRQARDLLAEGGMVVSMVMVVLFNEWPKSGELDTQLFYRRPAASMVAAGFGAC